MATPSRARTRRHHGRRATRRWLLRVVLGLVALLVLGLGAALIALHTAWGRELVRAQVQAALARSLVGGGQIGRIEGSPLGALIARDLVINGPDGQPAITARTARVELALVPLASRTARVERLEIDDLEVVLRRDADGSYPITRLTRPSDQPSAWSVELPDVRVRRARVALDTGAHGWHHLDDVELDAALALPRGGPIDATARLRGAWRERAQPIALDATVRSGAGTTALRALTAAVGGVTISTDGLTLAPRPGLPGAPPRIDGSMRIRAPARAVAALAPGVRLPADVALAARVDGAPLWTDLEVAASVGPTPVLALVTMDPLLRRARGVVATGALDLAALTGGARAGRVAVVASVDARAPGGARGAEGGLPRVRGVVTAWGAIEGAPALRAAVALAAGGEHVAAVVGLDGAGVRAALGAELRRAGDALTIRSARVIARTSDAARATGGAAPITGAFALDATVSGALAPAPALAVDARVTGRRLALPAQGGLAATRVATLELAVRADQLPRQPRGRAELVMGGIVREDPAGGGLALGRLRLTAANRPDGRIQVSLRSTPTPAPWQIDVDALVTPPGAGERVVVDLQRHQIRAASAGLWRGRSGRLEIEPRRIELRDLRSRGLDGTVAVAATLIRAGRGAGDLTAQVEATGFDLDNVSAAYRGRVDARVDVTRARGRWAGGVQVSARGLALDPRTLTLDVDATARARADRVVVDVRASSLRLGAARLELDVDAPKDVADAAAWRRLHRKAIRTARVSFGRVDLGALADLAGREAALEGTLDGALRITPDDAGGALRVRGVKAPQLATIGPLDLELALAQPAPRALAISLTGTLGAIGRLRADAALAVPDHLFDPDAWAELGGDAVRGASLRVADVELEPGLLDRFGVVSDLRGRASLVARVGAGLRDARVHVDLRELRGSPVAEPVTAHAEAAIDGDGARMAVSIRARGALLLELTGRVPVTLARLRADPAAALRRPLAITGRIPAAPASALLGVFGREQVTGGTLQGTLAVTGTVGAPRGTLRVLGTDLVVPPGRNGKPVKRLERVQLDGSWDGRTARLALVGHQRAGRLELGATVRPRALDRSTARLRATGFDLAPILAFAPGPAGGGAGRLDADLGVTSLDARTTRLAGELHLHDARLPLAPQIGTLRQARVDLVATARGPAPRLSLAVTGKLGDGDLAVTSAFALAGALPTRGQARIALRRVSPVGGVEPAIDADVDVELVREGALWKAYVNVRDGHVRVPAGKGEALGPIGAPPDMVFEVADEQVPLGQPRRAAAAPPAAPGLVAQVRLHPMFVESEEVRGVVRGRLTLSADAETIGVVGAVEAERGMLDLFGRRYTVDRAVVRFDGSRDPLLDVRITYDFPEVTTITEVRGRLSEPALIMTSQPGTYSQGQLLGFLLGGEPAGAPGSGIARDRATGAGASFIANRIGGYVRDALPIDLDVLRYEAASATSSAAITVGTWLTRSLFLAYRRRIEARPDENSNQGELEYWLSRRLMIEGVIGDRNFHGVDLLWRRRY